MLSHCQKLDCTKCDCQVICFECGARHGIAPEVKIGFSGDRLLKVKLRFSRSDLANSPVLMQQISFSAETILALSHRYYSSNKFSNCYIK